MTYGDACGSLSLGTWGFLFSKTLKDAAGPCQESESLGTYLVFELGVTTKWLNVYVS